MPPPTTTAPVYVDRLELLSAAARVGITSVAELARRCDLARVTMSRYVNKEYTLNPATEEKLRAVLGAEGRVKWITRNPAKPS